jgi:hypothetical protein
VNIFGGVNSDTLQYINKVNVGINTVHFTGDNEALDDANVLCADFRPTKHPILFPHWDRYNQIF